MPAWSFLDRMNDLNIPLDVETIRAWKNAEIILEYDDRELEIARCIAQYVARNAGVPLVMLQTLSGKFRELLKEADDFANSRGALRPPRCDDGPVAIISRMREGNVEPLFILPIIIYYPHEEKAQFVGFEHDKDRDALQQRVENIRTKIVADLTPQANLCPLSIIDLRQAFDFRGPDRARWAGE